MKKFKIVRTMQYTEIAEIEHDTFEDVRQLLKEHGDIEFVKNEDDIIFDETIEFLGEV